MQSNFELFVPLPLSVMLKLQKIKAYEALTPEQIVAAIIEEKLKSTGR